MTGSPAHRESRKLADRCRRNKEPDFKNRLSQKSDSLSHPESRQAASRSDNKAMPGALAVRLCRNGTIHAPGTLQAVVGRGDIFSTVISETTAKRSRHD
ncbi:hypothetical protein MPLB_630044 [Mesorhizobium sp. ORS 3324]|nr:hypothetical protein MPLB_630044 [Mesorhizobium sp. ORS 3324]